MYELMSYFTIYIYKNSLLNRHSCKKITRLRSKNLTEIPFFDTRWKYTVILSRI